jgi:hypothetical protein
MQDNEGKEISTDEVQSTKEWEKITLSVKFFVPVH